MSRRFVLHNNWYGDDYAIFKKKQIKINPGLTVLVGCNGAGKTTLLKQINQSLKNEDIPVLFHSNMQNGERELRSKAAFYGSFDIVARTIMSSEGENIVNPKISQFLCIFSVLFFIMAGLLFIHFLQFIFSEQVR